MIRRAVLVGDEVKVPLIYGLRKSEGRESPKHLHILNSPISSELKHCYRSLFSELKKGEKKYMHNRS